MSAAGSITTTCSPSCRLPSTCCPRRTARSLPRTCSSGKRMPVCKPIRRRYCRSSAPF
nr:MAG TPA: hypothetical protein [Caudoviricetes sp.]